MLARATHLPGILMPHLFTLGELRLLAHDGTVLSRRGKPLLLLTYLARHAPRNVPRAELAALLWGEREESRARHSLRQSLLELHKLVGDQLVIGHDTIRLDATDLDADVELFERDVDAGRDRAAIERWHGDFLRDADYRAEMALQTWVESERVRLRRLLTLAFERLLDDAQRTGSTRDALAIAKRWMELAPLDEHACSSLIGALRLAGHSAEALAVHTQFTSRARETNDAEPSRDFLRLAEALDEAARGEPPEHPRSSLPGLVALPLVGRSSVIAKLADAWRNAVSVEATVAVVIAEHGMGATRVCDELARSVQRSDASSLVLRTGVGPVPTTPARPLAAVSALLGSLGSANAMGGLAPETLATLARMLPALRTRFPHLPTLPASPLERADASVASREAIEAAADDAPVLVIVDALTNADPESQAALIDVATTMRGATLILFVLRPGDVAEEMLLHLRARLPNLIITTLRPLSVEDVSAMLEVAAPVAPDERHRLAEAIHADTAGTPLYVAAMIQYLLDERLLSATDAEHATALARLGSRELPVPVRIRADVRQRLRLLPGATQNVVDAIAVLGTDSTPAEVVQLTGLAPRDVDAGFVELEHMGVVHSGDASRRARLQPPVVERAVYALIPPLRREALHAAAARMTAPSRWYHAKRNPRTSYHRARAGGSAPRRRAWWVPVTATLVLAGIAAALLWPSRSDTSSHDRTVAIFPFAVSGGANVAYLEAGMADLLSTNLDGVGGLHTLDPRVVIAAALPRQPNAMEPDAARGIARRLGASFYVLGTVVVVNGQLSLAASLYHTRRGRVPIARATAGGSEGALFGLVDRLTAQLAVAQGAPSGERLSQLAAVTTTSLDALKAYLEGRSAYRANNLFAALPAFQRAVAADSSFALAWYGLATTASWMLNPALERRAAALAVRESGRLSPRDRLLVEAFAAYSRGAADSAERMATDIVATYDDIEGWVLLGEVLYHHNWKRGRQLTESRRAWERVLLLDPGYWPALQHLSEVAALERRDAEADSLLGRYERTVGTPHMMLASRALRAYRYGDDASRASLSRALSADRGFFLTASVWYVAVYGRDVASARLLAGMLVQPLRPPEQQAFGRTVLAHLDLAQGKWREARAELAIARALSPSDALEHELMLSMAPFLATPAADLAPVLEALRRLPLEPKTSSGMPWPRTNSALHPMLRAYLTGMVQLRAGRDVRPALTELADVPDPTGPMTLAQSFAASLRAQQLRREGRAAEALAEFERGVRDTPFVPAWTSAFVSQAHERYARAELLRELGRNDEALRWFATFGDNSPYDLVYLAPGLLQQARIYDARGERALARERYTQFVELWSDCDAQLRPLVTQARERIAQLR